MTTNNLSKSDNGLATIDLTANLTSQLASDSTSIFLVDSVFALPTEPVSVGKRVECRSYWGGNSSIGGAIFAWDAASTLPHDARNVIFSTVSETGRWLRLQPETPVNVDEYGAIGTLTIFNPDIPFVNQAPTVRLSDKFTTLALAQRWYPQADITALTETVNSAAIQQALEISKSVFVAGIYILNKSLKYAGYFNLAGKGRLLSTLCFTGTDNAWAPKKTGIYVKSFSLKSVSHYSDVVPTVNNVPTPNTIAYDETKSGFFLPRRPPNTPNEANDGAPLMIESLIEDCDFNRFAGDGLLAGNYFNSTIRRINADANKGFGIHTLANVCTPLEECYVSPYNGQGGYWLENGGVVKDCNGIDTSSEVPWGIIGNPKDPDKIATANFINCNFEGTGRAISCYGDGSRVIFDNCTFQWYVTNSATPYIRIYGGVSFVEFKGYCQFFPAFNNRKSLDVFMWVLNNGTQVKAENFNTSITIKYACVNQAGANIYGDRVFFDIQGSQKSFTEDGNNVLFEPLLGTKKLFLGRGPRLANDTLPPIVTLETITNGAPTTEANNGSLMLRQDGDSQNTLYLRSAATWSAVRTTPAVQEINASATVKSWDSIVVIGAPDLSGNITITLPPIGANNVGRSITFQRTAATGETVTIVAATETTAVLTTNLNTVNDRLVLTAVSAVRSVQTA
jgi:hypothetical protein